MKYASTKINCAIVKSEGFWNCIDHDNVLPYYNINDRMQVGSIGTY
jgi:hypothetical protein